MILKLSTIDRAIISMLQSNSEISQSKMSRRLGLSQPSISARLKKLKERGLLSQQVGLNLKKVDLYFAKVDLCVKSESNKLIEAFQDCPRFINGFITSGKYNLLFFFISEDMNTLEAIVNNCLRPLDIVTDVEFSIVLAPIKDFIAPILLIPDITALNGKAPCGASCKDCDMYNTDRCLGCPVTEAYKGSLWKKPQW